MQREPVGAFIDAVYAIAVTILALELPAGFEHTQGLSEFSEVLLEYALAFAILFGFWSQHRRANGFVERYGRIGLWLNGAILLLVCLVPRATTLVFRFGDDVTVAELHQTFAGLRGWNRAELVDLFYVLVVVAVDLLLLVLLRGNTRDAAERLEVRQLRSAKSATSIALLVVVALSFLLPVENRLVLVIVPLALIFERELTLLLPWARAAR